MIGYVTLGSNDLPRAARFYDALFGVIGIKRLMEMGESIIWGKPDAPGIGVLKPFDGQPATHGNGTMVALAARGPEQVQALYAKAMEMGSKDEGAPGPRGDSGFYAAYFRDLDGNKLCAFCMTK